MNVIVCLDLDFKRLSLFESGCCLVTGEIKRAVSKGCDGIE
jgi:hypothetical protein